MAVDDHDRPAADVEAIGPRGRDIAVTEGNRVASERGALAA